MGAELLPQRPPGSVQAAIQVSFLHRHQEMVGQDAEEDMSLRALFEMMEDGPLHQRTLHRPEGGLDARQQDIGAPDFVGGQVLVVGLQHVAAIQLGRDRFLLALLLPGQGLRLGIVVHPVIAGHARIAFSEPAHRLVNLLDRKSTRLNSSHGYISYAVFCLKKKTNTRDITCYRGLAYRVPPFWYHHVLFAQRGPLAFAYACHAAYSANRPP